VNDIDRLRHAYIEHMRRRVNFIALFVPHEWLAIRVPKGKQSTIVVTAPAWVKAK